jgi:hypothetical protein
VNKKEKLKKELSVLYKIYEEYDDYLALEESNGTCVEG